VQDFYTVDADGKERLRSISELPRALAASAVKVTAGNQPESIPLSAEENAM
jgi:hypothetical protein